MVLLGETVLKELAFFWQVESLAVQKPLLRRLKRNKSTCYVTENYITTNFCLIFGTKILSKSFSSYEFFLDCQIEV